MDNFKAIYKILRTLEAAIDYLMQNLYKAAKGIKEIVPGL